ncbi:unnamed protein product [Orchesella dallaii]|uniref:Uncharacterized protein n=1 Tax=Orchesella dallaii TaxID=48710 RepID=A0ABP1R699_9HEXA
MPLFIHNENEVVNEDDGPIPANSPSTGSIGSRDARVVACGNRVLEIIERHKNEVQSRMADREEAFKRMIENSKKASQQEARPTGERQQGFNDSSRRPSEMTIPHDNEHGIYNDAPELPPDRLESTETFRHSEASRRPCANLSFAESDEYMELPGTKHNATAPSPSKHSSYKEIHGNRKIYSKPNIGNSSRSSSRNANNICSKASVKFAEYENAVRNLPITEDPCGNKFSRASMAYDAWAAQDKGFAYPRDSQNNVPSPSHHSVRRPTTYTSSRNSILSSHHDIANNNYSISNLSRQEMARNIVRSDVDTSDINHNLGPSNTSQESLRSRAFRGNPSNYSHSTLTAGSAGSSLSAMSALRRRTSTSSSQNSSVETIQSTRRAVPTAANRIQIAARNVTDYVREYIWRIIAIIITVLLLFGLMFLSLDAWKNSSTVSSDSNMKKIYYGPIM